MSRRREVLLVLFVLTLATAVYLKDVLFFGQRLLAGDLLAISEPWRSVLGDRDTHNYLLSDPIQAHYPRQAYFWGALKQGHFPIWNPYIFLGIPCDPMTVGVFADVGQLVTSLPSLLLPLDSAWGVVAALRLVLSGFFMYLMMRQFKASVGGALLAAIVFMFAANTIVWLEYPQHLAAQLWMPLVLLFCDRMLTRRQWSDALFTAVFLTLMLYNWYLQLTLYMLWFLFLFFLWHQWKTYRQEHDWRSMGTMTLLFAVAIGMALLMASVKILTYHEATLSSVRAIQHGRAQLLAATPLDQLSPSYLISRLVTFFFPTFYADGIEHIYWGPGNAVEAAQYLGLVPLYLIAVALCCKPRRRGTLVFTGLGLFLLMVRLKVPPLVNLAGLTPLVGLGAISRLATIVTFLLALVAGLGLTALEENEATRMRAVAGALCGTLLGSILIVRVAWWIKREQLSIRPYTADGLWITGAMTVATLLLFYLFLRGRIGRKSMVLGTVLLTFVDLFVFGSNFNTTAPPEMIYPRTKATDFLRRDPAIFRVLVLHSPGEPMAIAPSDTLQTYQIPEVGGRDPHLPRQYRDFFAQVMGERAVTLNGYLLPSRFRYPALWGMLNVKYVLSQQDLPANQLKGLHLVYANELKIYRNLKWQPRVFAVPQIRVLTGETELVQELKAPSFDPSREALVLDAPKWASHKTTSLSADTVDLTSVGTDEVRVQVRLSQPHLVVLSTRYDDGWQVYVDGSQRKVYRTNGILMAVPVEAGRHSVRFVYAPENRRWNLVVRTATPLLIAGVFFALKRRTSRKQNDPGRFGTRRWVLLALVGLALASLMPVLLQAPIPERSLTPTGQTIGTSFGDLIRLEKAILNAKEFALEGRIDLTLHWRALQPMETSYTVFIHVVGQDGRIYVQRDTGPLDGGYPTNMWRPNELVADYHQLTLPDNAPPGQYRVMIGLYDQATMERLPALNIHGERWDADGVWLEIEMFRSEF